MVLAGAEVAVRLAGRSILLVAGAALPGRRHRRRRGTSFAAANKGLGTTPGHLRRARSAGFNPAHGFSLTAHDPDAAVGVLRRRLRPGLGADRRRGQAGARTQYFAMVGGVLINGAVLAVDRADLPARGRHAVGRQPVVPEQHRAGQAALPGGVPPSINLIASLLTGSVPLLLLIGVGFILWALMGTPLSTLQATRYMLAWSLDRTVPQAARRGQRPVPHPGQGDPACGVTGEVALFALVQVPQASLLGALLAQIVAFIVVIGGRHRVPLPAQGRLGGRRRPPDRRRPGRHAGRHRRRGGAGRDDAAVHLQLHDQLHLRGDPAAVAGAS